MLYIKADYYDSFRCTANHCEDTCCAGWQIMIDSETLGRYKKEKGPYRRELHKGIIWREKAFRQKENRRCAFLNDENLCDLYTALGEEALCHTCSRYPRHIEEFENVREMTLSLSCPEVAKYLMSRTEAVNLIYEETEEEDDPQEYEDMEFDVFLYDILEQGRALLISILQDRSVPLKQRCERALHLTAELEQMIEAGNAFSAFELFDLYEKKEESYQKRRLRRKMDYSCKVFAEMERLERLRVDWNVLISESEAYLFHKGEEFYNIQSEIYEAWKEKDGEDVIIALEQIVVYFVMTYFCGAVYDGRILSKVQSAVLSTYMMNELFKARWLMNEKTLDHEDFSEIIYRYSRELEHSDENLIRIEKIAASALPVKI